LKRIVDYSGTQILLSAESERHIAAVHPEIDFDHIRKALENPDEVRMSSYRSTSVLYYRAKAAKRFICVVVKACSDGNFISSAMTTGKPKTGEIIYVRGS
jgi:hypothetical protein